MQHDQKQLHEIARDYLCHMFTVEEIALLCNISRDVVSRARAAADSPFFLNKCRPEWFLEWMRQHPDLQLTKAPPTSAPPCENCSESQSKKISATKRTKKTRAKSFAVAEA
jgi:hypothetical protein